MPQKPVRLVDVARAAGVSVPTASQVMNDSGRVADATRRRVLAAARELDYRPNALARSVALGRSRTIGVLAENAAGAFCMPVLIGITRVLSEADLASLLFDARHDGATRREHIRHMLDRHVDGIIIIGEGADVAIGELGEAFDGPLVHAFGPPAPVGALDVRPDEELAGRIAAEQLLALGKRRYVHVTAAADLSSVKARAAGFLAALDEAGVEPSAVLHGEFSRDWGQRAASEILTRYPDTDAVFAASDAIAVGLVAEFEARGRRVPDDVAVIGYDNVAGYSDDTRPYMASIDPSLQTVGEHAASALLAALDGNAPDVAAVRPVYIPGVTTSGDADVARHGLIDALLRSTTPPPPGTPTPPRAAR